MDNTERTARIVAAANDALASYRALVRSHPVMPRIDIPGLAAMQALQASLPRMPVLPAFAVDPGMLAATEALNRSMASMAQLTEPMRRFNAFIETTGRQHRMLEASGWLPHYTTPFDRLAETDDAEEVGRLLEAYYSDGWPAVRTVFLEHLATYDIDDEARSVFTLALDLHGAGHWRAVSPLLFLEIERIARSRLHEGALDGFASQRRLRELAGRLSPARTQPAGLHGLQLYQRLDDHLYRPVKTAEALVAAKADPVPNRHAVLHGLVAYDSRQNSINALIMFDFVLQVFSAVGQAPVTAHAA